ncbi:MAG: cell division protein FtsX [Pseudolabrys sp.]
MTDEAATKSQEAPRPRGRAPRNESPIVPPNTISGRALVAVVAIMTFLASLTTGAVILVQSAASDWQADVAREITIQIAPAPGRDLDAAVEKAAALATRFHGVGSVRAVSKEESTRLLEPWLGSGLSLAELPVPRLIVVTIASGAAPDLAELRRLLRAEVPGATLDDHRGWIERMRAMAGTAVAAGVIILVLMIAATVLSVSFATHGAMAANKPVIEVLHFIGARNRFIARNFERHFLILGLKGGAIGGAAALALFVFAGALSRSLTGTAAGEQTAALFGTFSIGIAGYVAVLAQIVLIALVTAWTSRQTVNRTLDAID